MLLGDMQDWKPNVASIIEYAADIYPESEVVSKLVSGEVHRTNYKEVCVRSRKLASKLSQDGYNDRSTNYALPADLWSPYKTANNKLRYPNRYSHRISHL